MTSTAACHQELSHKGSRILRSIMPSLTQRRGNASRWVHDGNVSPQVEKSETRALCDLLLPKGSMIWV